MRILNDLEPGTFDLHIHTTASDGTLTPSEVVALAKQSELSTIAITDHDTLSGIEEALEAGNRSDVAVIPGIELSSRYLERPVDVLGYNLQRLEEMERTLSGFREARKNRARDILDRLAELDIHLSLEDILASADKGSIGRPHIARALVAKGCVPDLQTAFDLYLADDRPAAVPKRTLHPVEAIDLIHQADGQAVLAHPGLIRDDNLVEELLIHFPFDGLEVWHRTHAPGPAARYGALTEKRGLWATGGSDFHSPPHRLGRMQP